MPFHTYINGLLLKVNWDLYVTPRILSVILGCFSIPLIYYLSLAVFRDRQIGLISALLLTVNPVHTWLSAVPLTEIYHFSLILGALISTTYYISNSKTQYFLIAGVLLALATGFRFESWIYVILFNLFGIFMYIFRTRTQLNTLSQKLIFASGFFIPWIFPLIWTINNYLFTGNPFYSTFFTLSYNNLFYDSTVDLSRYLNYTYKTDPILILLGPLATIILLFKGNQEKTIQWYLGSILIPYLIFIFIQGGRSNPDANYIRYLATYNFLLYPLVAWFVYISFRQLTINTKLKKLLSMGFLLTLSLTQIFANYQYDNDPSSVGIEVGRKIEELYAKDATYVQGKTMVELGYWDHLAVSTGSNSPDLIIFDREYDPINRSTSSIFFDSPDTIHSCLKSYQVNYIAVRDPELISIVAGLWSNPPFVVVNNFAFFTIPNNISTHSNTSVCNYALTIN